MWGGYKRIWDDTLNLELPANSYVLDLGCGNGRLAEFIHNRCKATINYLGIDLSKELLIAAESKLSKLANANFIYKLAEADLTELDLLEKLTSKTEYNLINLLAVFHHFPDQESRIKLLNYASKILAPKGFLIFTTWNFLSSPTLVDNINLVDADKFLAEYKLELKSGDHLISWNNDKSYFRFAHDFSKLEIKELLNIPGLKLREEFTTDGKNAKLNNYYLLQKI